MRARAYNSMRFDSGCLKMFLRARDGLHHAIPRVTIVAQGIDGPGASKELIKLFADAGYRLAVENVTACRQTASGA